MWKSKTHSLKKILKNTYNTESDHNFNFFITSIVCHVMRYEKQELNYWNSKIIVKIIFIYLYQHIIFVFIHKMLLKINYYSQKSGPKIYLWHVSETSLLHTLHTLMLELFILSYVFNIFRICQWLILEKRENYSIHCYFL